MRWAPGKPWPSWGWIAYSFADLPLIRHSLSKTPARHLCGRLAVAAASEGFKAAGMYGWYARLAFGLYPLRRSGAGRESLRELAAIAGAGNTLLVFPQGRHARPEQERAGDRTVAFKLRTAQLARDLGAVVVPFGLAGTEEAMPAFLEEYRGPVIAGIPVSLRRVPLAIAYGAPVSLEPGESLQQFTRRLQEASYALTRRAEAALADKRAGCPRAAGSATVPSRSPDAAGCSAPQRRRWGRGVQHPVSFPRAFASATLAAGDGRAPRAVADADSVADA